MSSESGPSLNPYTSLQQAEVVHPRPPGRPIGLFILAVLLVISGVLLGGQRMFQLESAYSQGDNVVIHPSYYVGLTRDAISALTAIVGGVGIMLRHQYGWWSSLVHGYWRLATIGILPLIGAFANSRMDAVSTLVAPSLVVVVVILYLQKQNVLAYLNIGRGRGIANMTICVTSLVVAFGLDLWWALTQTQGP